MIRRLARGLARRVLDRFGLEVRRRQSPPQMGTDLGTDLGRLLAGTARPVVFDVGANVGEFLARMRRIFPEAAVHAFEPSPGVFETLRRAAGHLPDVTLNNVAVGSRREERLLQEHSSPVMSSLLPPGPDAWSEVRRETPVRVETVDAYCAERGVARIDLLKIDTQGFDLEVLRGTERMLVGGLVRLVLLEWTFPPLYRGMAEPDALYRNLADRGFRMIGLYDWWYDGVLPANADALFLQMPEDRPGR